MSQTLNDLRAIMFETLIALKSGNIDLEKARSINEIGKTLIDSAKVEVEYMKTAGLTGSGFIESEEHKPKLEHHTKRLPESSTFRLAGLTRHTMGDD